MSTTKSNDKSPIRGENVEMRGYRVGRSGTFSGVTPSQRDAALGLVEEPTSPRAQQRTVARRMSLAVYLPGEGGIPSKLSLASSGAKRRGVSVPTTSHQIPQRHLADTASFRSLTAVVGENTEAKKLIASMNPYTLRFGQVHLETDFNQHFITQKYGVIMTRAGLGLGFVLFVLLMIAKVLPQGFNLGYMLERLLIWVLMFILPLLVVLISTWLLGHSFVRKAYHPMVAIVGCLCVGAVIHSSALDASVMEVSTIVPLVILVGAFSHFTRILFMYLFPALLVIIADFVITVVLTEKEQANLSIILVNSGFVVATCVIFAFGSYAYELTTRRNFLLEREIELENRELRATVTEMMAENDESKNLPVDLEAPIQKVLSVLKALRQSPALGRSEMNLLDFIERVLSSKTDLFAPNIGLQLRYGSGDTGGIDRETRNWLMKDITRDHAPSREDLYSSMSMGSIRFPSPAPIHSGTVFPTSLVKGKDADAVEALLKQAGRQHFDAIALSKLCSSPLTVLGVYLFRIHSLLDRFSIPESKLIRYLTSVERMYKHVPFHNNVHACDVLSTTHGLIMDSMSSWMNELEILACLIAAAVHDVGHPGFSSSFLIESMDRLAIIYNDGSPLENFHASSAFKLMLSSPDTNILSNLERAEFVFVRQLVISLILGTDLSNHFQLLSTFQRITSELDGIIGDESDDRTIVLQVAMKIADVHNVAKPPFLYQLWTNRVMDEFYRQGDAERDKSMTISPFMNRENPNIKGCQCGFIDFICTPLFTAWCHFTNDDTMLGAILANRHGWTEDNATDLVMSNPGDGLDMTWDETTVDTETSEGDAEHVVIEMRLPPKVNVVSSVQ